MNAQQEFEHSLATMLNYYNAKLSIVKGNDKKMHLQATSWVSKDPVYLDDFVDADWNDNMYWNKHFKPTK